MSRPPLSAPADFDPNSGRNFSASLRGFFDAADAADLSPADALGAAFEAFAPPPNSSLESNLFPLWLAWLVERFDDSADFDKALRTLEPSKFPADLGLWRFFDGEPELSFKDFCEAGRPQDPPWDALSWTFVEAAPEGPRPRKPGHLSALLAFFGEARPDEVLAAQAHRHLALIFGRSCPEALVAPLAPLAACGPLNGPVAAWRPFFPALLCAMADFAYENTPETSRRQRTALEAMDPDFEATLFRTCFEPNRTRIGSAPNLPLLHWMESAGFDSCAILGAAVSDHLASAFDAGSLAPNSFDVREILSAAGSAMFVAYENSERTLYSDRLVRLGRNFVESYPALVALTSDAKAGRTPFVGDEQREHLSAWIAASGSAAFRTMTPFVDPAGVRRLLAESEAVSIAKTCPSPSRKTSKPL